MILKIILYEKSFPFEHAHLQSFNSSIYTFNVPHMVLRNHCIGVSHRLIFEKSEADRHTTLAHLQFHRWNFIPA